jgi:hypothetical protein
MNRPQAAVDRRPADISLPRLHLAAPNDADAAKTEAAAAEPVPRQRASLYDACAELKARKEQAKSGAEQATHRQRALGKMTVRERLEAWRSARSPVTAPQGLVSNAAARTPMAW